MRENGPEMEMEGGPEALPEAVTLGPLASTGKVDATETIARLQEMLEQAQGQQAAVLGRYVKLLRQREDVIPEMVDGATLDEVDSNLAASQAAFKRLVSRLAAGKATSDSNEVADYMPERSQPLEGDGVALLSDGAMSPQSRRRGLNVPAGGGRRRGREELLAEEAQRLDPIGKIRLGLESR